MMEQIAAKIIRAESVLRQKFGIPQWNRKDPLDELMVTLLSQNTNDNNRDLAYRRLRERYPQWQQVLNAEVAEIEQLIKPAGLGGQKSLRMKELLLWVMNTFGALNLDYLREMNDDEILSMLTKQKGIGVKTAAVVMAFSLDRDLCPVDTHVHRIAQRLGWADEKLSAEKTFFHLRPMIPKGVAAPFHLNLLKFGRTICQARCPRCQECPLWDDCVWEKKEPKKI